MKRMRRRRELRKWEWKFEMKMKTTNLRSSTEHRNIFFTIRLTGKRLWLQKRRSREKSSTCCGWPGLKIPLLSICQLKCVFYPGFVLSWSLSLCPASTKRLARASSRTIISCLLSEQWALSSTALEGFSMAFSWTGSKHSRKHSQKHSHGQA